jgi:hypothetical protein
LEIQNEKAYKRKTIFRIVYILGTIIAFILIGLLSHDVETLRDLIPKINLKWIGVAIVSVMLFWLSDSILLSQITSYIYEKQKFHRSLRAGMMGLYYGALTPFASGGQPAQIVYMKRDGIPYGVSTSIVTIKFIVYELSLCLLFIVAMIWKGSFYFENYKHVFWLTSGGFLLNLIAVAFITMVMFNRNLAGNIVHGIINFLTKVKIIRKTARRTREIDKKIDDFYLSSAYIKNNKLNFFLSILVSTINIAFLFSVPYFIYRAFGFSQESFILIFTLQAFLYLAVSLIPLPGAAGASEGGFYLFFSGIFTAVPIFMPMIIWRFLTYYLILLIGTIFVTVDQIVHMHRTHQKRLKLKNRKRKKTSQKE